MASKTRYGWELLGDILAAPNIRDLIEAYYEELSPLKEVAPLDPDWAEMAKREAAGAFRVWAARVDGTLAGFVSWHIVPHLQHRQTLFALDAGHFLAPAFRDKGMLGYHMWKSATAALKTMGVRVIIAHDNSARPLMPFFLALGYEPRSTLFMKVLV